VFVCPLALLGVGGGSNRSSALASCFISSASFIGTFLRRLAVAVVLPGICCALGRCFPLGYPVILLPARTSIPVRVRSVSVALGSVLAIRAGSATALPRRLLLSGQPLVHLQWTLPLPIPAALPAVVRSGCAVTLFWPSLPASLPGGPVLAAAPDVQPGSTMLPGIRPPRRLLSIGVLWPPTTPPTRTAVPTPATRLDLRRPLAVPTLGWLPAVVLTLPSDGALPPCDPPRSAIRTNEWSPHHRSGRCRRYSLVAQLGYVRRYLGRRERCAAPPCRSVDPRCRAGCHPVLTR
jgi:hypothetical protein